MAKRKLNLNLQESLEELLNSKNSISKTKIN